MGMKDMRNLRCLTCVTSAEGLGMTTSAHASAAAADVPTLQRSSVVSSCLRDGWCSPGAIRMIALVHYVI